MKNLDRLLEEISYSYKNVPFYHKKLNEMGIVPADIKTLQDVQRLPFTAKVDFRKHFPRGVIAESYVGKIAGHPMLTNSRSSGSTGERLITIELGMHLLQRALSCSSVNNNIHSAFSKTGRRIARYAAPNCSDVECANPNSKMTDRLLPDNTLVLSVYHDLLTTPERIVDQTIEELEKFKPDLFYVDPTHFAFLLRQYQKRKLAPPDAPVMVAFTGATEVSKRQIGRFYSLKSRYAELLSSTEFGWIAMECPHGELHLNDESFFFEFIPVGNSSTSEEEFFELCISSIDQGASPHVRYRTGDIVTKVECSDCACGSSSRRIVMQGRSSYFVTWNNQLVASPTQVDRAIGAPEWLDLYQFEQVSGDEFLLKMVVNELYEDGVEVDIISRIQEKLKRNIQPRTSVVEYIPSERSGKFQSVKGKGLNV